MFVPFFPGFFRDFSIGLRRFFDGLVGGLGCTDFDRLVAGDVPW